MTLSTPENSASVIKVAYLSSRGIWLLTQDEELFMPYQDFPWFKDQTAEAILNVEEPSPEHYYWPVIDVDLTEEIIKYPGRFPLMAKVM